MTSKVLMCRPTFYGVDYSINPWMKDNIGKVDNKIANEQWEALYQAISKVAEVFLIDGVSGLPDMVFAANAGKVMGNTFYPSVFAHKERQPETNHWVKYFVERVFNIRWPDYTFEGEGDYLLTSNGWTWAGYGFRSKHEAVGSNFRFELNDPRFYHLDTCFCPLPDKNLLWYPPACANASKESIAFSFNKIIEASEEDALNFACNAVCIGNNIFLPKNTSVTPQLEALGYTVHEFDMSEFIKSGGACKCLVLYLD